MTTQLKSKTLGRPHDGAPSAIAEAGKLPPRARSLTLKQRRFVEAYIGEAQGNATLAARIAGYKGRGATLRVVAAQTLTKPHVSAFLEELFAETRELAVLTRDDILVGLAAIARGEIDEPHVLQSGETVYAPPKFQDRIRAFTTSAKLQGLLVDKVEIKALDGLQAQLRELQERMSDGAFEELLVALSQGGATS